MPRNERLVICGDVEGLQESEGTGLRLNLHGSSPNVRLRISDVSKRLLANIPDDLVDLLEVASYIYAADSALSRGGKTDARMGAHWRRNFRFVIPVRLPDLWSSKPVSSALVETLSFLSDDEYEFEFQPLDNPPLGEVYFELPDSDATGFRPDEIVMFSGGLDSLAGTIEELAVHNKNVVLVSHRSATKISGVQQRLVDQLHCRFGTNRIFHVPVWVTLDGTISNESTHRTRSFLFAALGAVTARLFDRNRVRFFENGVVSLNLPPVGQVVGARATRTTHPQAIAGFRRVFSEVLRRPFDIGNPFAWLTKSEVVERISANGFGGLIRDTRSCTRVHDMTRLHTHCGRCSQCIDRRFAVLAAGQEHEDPAEAYKVDLFTGEREVEPEREMALAYVRSTTAIRDMSDIAFFTRYGETSRIVASFPEQANTVASRIFDLHKRHASVVCHMFDEAVSTNASALREGILPSTCLISLVIGHRQGEAAYPERCSAREPDVKPDREIRIGIPENNKSVIFDRWGRLTGASAKFLIALAGPHEKAVKEKRAPERYSFTKTWDLVDAVGAGTDETLRRRVNRCRKAIGVLAKTAGESPPSLDAVIENDPRRGYRLNPTSVRLVSTTEVAKV